MHTHARTHFRGHTHTHIHTHTHTHTHTQKEERRRGTLPKVLYLQLDNCVRENKNTAVAVYLSWLVERGVFDAVFVSYLPVGHTHNECDQLASRLGVGVRWNECKTLDEFLAVLKGCLSPTPLVELLDSVANTVGMLNPTSTPRWTDSKARYFEGMLALEVPKDDDPSVDTHTHTHSVTVSHAHTHTHTHIVHTHTHTHTHTPGRSSIAHPSQRQGVQGPRAPHVYAALPDHAWLRSEWSDGTDRFDQTQLQRGRCVDRGVLPVQGISVGLVLGGYPKHEVEALVG